MNECLKLAAEKQCVTTQMVSDAESTFSDKRRISLNEEWSAVYPAVDKYLEVLTRRPNSFPASELSEKVLQQWFNDNLTTQDYSDDPVYLAGRRYFIDGKGSSFEVALVLLSALYDIGAVGLKPDKTSQISWSYRSDFAPAQGSIRPDSTLYIHAAFWRVLGIRPCA